MLSEFSLNSPVEASTDDQASAISYGMYMNAQSLLSWFSNLKKKLCNHILLWLSSRFSTDYNLVYNNCEFYKILVQFPLTISKTELDI